MDYIDKKIIQMLNNSRESYITSSEISKELKLSEKTIRNRIRGIQNNSLSVGTEIEMIPRKGIRMIVKNSRLFTSFLNHEKLSKDLFLSTKEDRIDFITQCLLLNTEYINLTKLSNKIHISRSVLSSDLAKVKATLSKDNITIIYENNKGFCLNGKEEDIRRCTVRYLKQKDTVYTQLLHKNHFIGLDEKVRLLVEQESFMISPNNLDNLIHHLYVLLHRISNNKILEVKSREYDFIAKDKIEEFATKLVEMFEEDYLIKLPENEFEYLMMHLEGKQDVDKIEGLNALENKKIMNIVDEVLDMVYKDWNVDLRSDKEFINNLILHIYPLLIRIDTGFESTNSMLHEIQNNLSLAYLLAIQAINVIQRHVKNEISLDEVGFLALHFDYALMKKQKSMFEKKVLVITSENKIANLRLKNKLMEKFSSYILDINFIHVNEIENSQFAIYDLILTTEDIVLDRELIKINYFLSEQDLIRINRGLQSYRHYKVEDFFPKELYLKDVSLKTKEEVIAFMVDKANEYLDLPKDFYDSVLKREKESSTDYGNNIAIPHSNKYSTKKTVAIVVILNQPILWNRNMVQLVVLSCVRKVYDEELDFYERTISKLLTRKHLIQEVITNREYSKFMDILVLIEEEVMSKGE